MRQSNVSPSIKLLMLWVSMMHPECRRLPGRTSENVGMLSHENLVMVILYLVTLVSDCLDFVHLKIDQSVLVLN